MPHEEPEDCPNLPGAKRFRYKPDVSNGAEPKGAEGGGRSVGAMMDAKVVDLRARRANGGTPHLAHDTEARESRGGIPSGSGMLSRVIKAVKEHETLSKVRFDELAMCPVLEDGNPVPDELILDIRIIAETEKTQVSDALARSAVQGVALRRKFDPLIEMFEKLPAWDGVNRLDTWLIKYASATDDEVSRRCGRKRSVASVRRNFVLPRSDRCQSKKPAPSRHSSRTQKITIRPSTRTSRSTFPGVASSS